MRRGKTSTIIITVFLALVTIAAIYLLLLDIADFKDILKDAKNGIESSNHVAEGAAYLFVAWFGAIAIVFVIFLIIAVMAPSIIMIIFTSINIKSDIKWIKVLNILYTIILASYIVLGIVKTVMLVVY